MKIDRVETTVEMNHFVEKDVIGVSTPYFVRRIAYPNKIVWLGLNTNWTFENGNWHQLEGSEFVKSDTPEYELEYQKATTSFYNPS